VNVAAHRVARAGEPIARRPPSSVSWSHSSSRLAASIRMRHSYPASGGRSTWTTWTFSASTSAACARNWRRTPSGRAGSSRSVGSATASPVLQGRSIHLCGSGDAQVGPVAGTSGGGRRCEPQAHARRAPGAWRRDGGDWQRCRRWSPGRSRLGRTLWSWTLAFPDWTAWRRRVS
jgi:hypothetical protein